MTGAYLEVALTIPSDAAAALARTLQDVAPGGIALEEPYVSLGPDEGVRLEHWRPAVLKLYLPDDEMLPTRRAQLTRALAALPLQPELRERSVREQDWAESWKAFFDVERAGQRLVIRPSWRDYAPQPGELVIDLDPGMAFGTGQHPTTRMCLQLLEQRLQAGSVVLDLGCGSGIISLAAAKLGAASVLALDIEPLAVEATRANARGNDVDERLRAERGSLGPDWPLAESATSRFDAVVANINAAALIELAEPIAAALRPGGLVIGSGVIAERLDAVLAALAAAGIASDRLLAEGDWRAIAGARR